MNEPVVVPGFMCEFHIQGVSIDPEYGVPRVRVLRREHGVGGPEYAYDGPTFDHYPREMLDYDVSAHLHASGRYHDAEESCEFLEGRPCITLEV